MSSPAGPAQYNALTQSCLNANATVAPTTKILRTSVLVDDDVARVSARELQPRSHMSDDCSVGLVPALSDDHTIPTVVG